MSEIDLSGLRDALDDSANECVLQSVDLKGISDLIKSGRVQNLITMAGAGISTAAGIPDFRSPRSGLYDNLEQYDLPYPTAVFEIGYFQENPEPFFEVARRLYHPDAKPTLAHFFIRLLHEKQLLRKHFTQNVDNLERLAGLPDNKLVEAHGSFHTGHCMICKKLYDFEYMRCRIMDKKVPKCKVSGCEGVVKPDIVFFGEGLPENFYSSLSRDFPACDLLIIMGTSLTVAPFCTLVDRVGSSVPRLYLNREAPVDGFDGIPWDDPKNKRDVFVSGDADDSVLRLADLLGWKDELLEMKKKTDAELDRAQVKSSACKV